ncbi:Protein CBG18561 [Caenorhabditis briggsae]|uniref:Serpentine receptor class r-10 n=1 Tax=Caenorhabditis briggsae TaxID=6238 RepID=A8XTK9_CAEBR|nr:Protein CBG18561 [Caenorhabditis briggsae]CAP35986.2 Protein CBG18561 [Caenorhabditis briggsae]
MHQKCVKAPRIHQKNSPQFIQCLDAFLVQGIRKCVKAPRMRQSTEYASTVITVLHIIHYFGSIAAQISNAVLLYLIIKKAGTLFGSYRYVMGVFSTYSLIYAWIDAATCPIMLIYGPAFVVYMDGPFKYISWIGNNIVCLYCGLFALVISLLATQFYYRYVVFCRPEIMSHLNGWKLARLFIPSIILVIIYFTIVKFGMAMTSQKINFVKIPLEIFYNENSEKVQFFGPMYYGIGVNGEKIWNVPDLLSAFGCFLIIVICFSTIAFCATKIYLQLKSKSTHFSAKTIEMNRQLFVTLIFQTLLPFITMYSPVGLILTLPFFEIPAGRAANFVGASLAIYPCLEPLIAMICIKDFRNIIFCTQRKVTTPSQTGTFGK